MKVLLRRLTNSATAPMRATPASFGYDLSLIEHVEVFPKSKLLLRTGLALAAALPDGVAMTLWPRSSLFWKKGVMLGNSIGLIDQDYADEIQIVAYNTLPVPVTFRPGDRVAQLVFLPVLLPEVELLDAAVEALTRGGFGSTGQ